MIKEGGRQREGRGEEVEEKVVGKGKERREGGWSRGGDDGGLARRHRQCRWGVMREKVRERENWVRECGKWKKGGLNLIYIYIYIVTTWILSLLATFSDELRFVADNNTNVSDFPFSDNLFLSLFVKFNEEMGFVINSMTNSTISDECFCRKKT